MPETPNCPNCPHCDEPMARVTDDAPPGEPVYECQNDHCCYAREDAWTARAAADKRDALAEADWEWRNRYI